MAQPLRALYPGEASPPPRPSLSPGSRPNRLWIAVYLPEVEHRELVSLACRARRITPLVSLEPPHALILEIGGSLKLWGGLDSIREALNRELDRRRLTARLCAAPTALAALWLARDGRKDVLSVKRLAGCLGALPLHVTGWPQATRRLLKKMGLGTVGDCLRLPRDGLVRRVGRRCLDDLERSLGRQPDLRTAFRPDRRRPARQATAPGCPQRPLWLLSTPVSVTAADGEWGHLRLESGPERIEAGWWEGLDTSRDYYVARGSRGRRLWVFRDRRCDRGDWYLHGIFG